MKYFYTMFSMLVLSMLAGCLQPTTPSSSISNPNDSSASTSVSTDSNPMRILTMSGPTAMGLVSMMDGVDSGIITDHNYAFTIATAVDEIAPKLAKSEIDIATVPANMASILYNSTDGGVQVLGINTLGVLYIVENGNQISSIEDLNGKTIYASGKGATPEYALNYILDSNNIDATIEWKSEHTECLIAVSNDDDGIAMLPQPFVSTAQMKNENIRVAIDLTAEWERLQEYNSTPSALITGVVIGRTEYIEQNPEVISAFLEHYKTSVDFINLNHAAGAALVGKYEIAPTAVAEKAIPNCNITLIQGAEMEEKLSGYLSVLLHQNPNLLALHFQVMIFTTHLHPHHQ